MAIVFKKALCKNVADKSAVAKYHLQLLTLGQSVGIDRMVYQMKENSSLSKGDILSVIANFVECMRTNLYNGHSVNIRDFGVFSLSARTEGAEDGMEFVNLQTYLDSQKGNGGNAAAGNDREEENP